jgi:hypothetical protein
MHPRVRRDLALHRQLDHVHRRRMSRGPARPAFQRCLKFPDRRIARTPDGVERQARPRFAAMAHDLKPAIAAVQTLRDCRRGLRRSAETFHLFRPQQAFSSVRFAGGFPRLLARMFGADLRAAHPIAEDSPSARSAHRAITAGLAGAGNATRI